ncbi:hypothetical protein AYJ57_11640 [Salipiger sp. CCB-MM3]|uniref:hypothetical protein n=1 Tax=Salipiger sp. CCB-MM3 TaxID=1792508 RepID=UPI00080AA499|nr:hypothetical protein [Salipiger sp. CCB-MM3]ANT60958.1 hypothetical protein AYJ57_11640 [Salipiger sp. CCB-MM3]
MDRHIVIAGQGRSGSTLFYNMLRNTLQGYGMFDREVPAASVIQLPGNQCTKRPFDIFDLPKLFQANQGRKRIDLICMLRDPRDILTSRHRSVPDDYFVAADNCWFVPEGRVPAFTAPGFLPVHEASMRVSGSGLFPQGIFFLKYEDLVRDPEAVQQMLAEGLGLTFEGRFSDFHKAEIPQRLQRALNGVREVDTERQRKWAKPEHRARIIDQFTRFPVLHDVLKQLGYEEDQGWFEDLQREAQQEGVAVKAAVPAAKPAAAEAAAETKQSALPVTGSILDHPAIPVLYEDATMKLSGIEGSGPQCLVTFVGVGHGLGGIDQQSEEFRKLSSGGWGSQLFVFDKTRSWGNALDPELLARLTAPHRAGRKVSTLGLSMGGFLAAQMSRPLGAARCIALAPQYSVHPEIAPFDTRWTRYSEQISTWRQPSLMGSFDSACRYELIFPDLPVELAHAERFPKAPNIRRFTVPSDNHNVAATLKARGQLYPLLEALLREDGAGALPDFCTPGAAAWHVAPEVAAAAG